jgi:hypothetical protein
MAGIGSADALCGFIGSICIQPFHDIRVSHALHCTRKDLKIDQNSPADNIRGGAETLAQPLLQAVLIHG